MLLLALYMYGKKKGKCAIFNHKQLIIIEKRMIGQLGVQ